MKIELTNREYNIVVQALRSQSIDLWKKIGALEQDDFRRKSYGQTQHDTTALINKLRQYKKDED